MNHIDGTRPAPLSIKKLATEYWNLLRFRIRLKVFRNSKYQNPRNKTEALVLLKKRNKFVIFRLVWLITYVYLSAMHRICIPAGAVILATPTLN